MKKIITTLLAIGLLMTSCSNSDDTPSNTISLEGSLFLRSGFVIDTPVDANGDGVYSNDLMTEKLCYDLQMNFREDLKVSNPTHDAISLYVTDDGNGNLTQTINCTHADGLPTNYKLINGNVVEFTYGNGLEFTGVLSADGNTLTFNFPNELLFGFNFFNSSNRILREDGTIEAYNGGAVVTYTRQ